MEEVISQEGIVNKPDFKEYYEILYNYICLNRRQINKGNENESSESDDEKEKIVEENKSRRDAEKKQYSKLFQKTCATISKSEVSFLDNYINCLIKIYEEERDMKKDVKAVLVSEKSLGVFRSKRSKLDEIYKVLISVNKTFSIDDYNLLSLKPRAAIYGSVIKQTKDGSQKLGPLGNAEIIETLDVFMKNKDTEHFTEWVLAILAFDKDLIVEVFREEYTPIREELVRTALNKIKEDPDYKHVISKSLFEEGLLAKIMKLQATSNQDTQKTAKLENRIKELEENAEKEKADFEGKRIKQYDRILQLTEENTTLFEKTKSYEKLGAKLETYIVKYEAQIAENERITIGNKILIEEKNFELRKTKAEYEKIRTDYEEIRGQFESLESDLSLRSNELLRLKESISKQEDTVKYDLLKLLATEVNEQMFYLTMFYLELQETGRLENETIKLFNNVIRNIDAAFVSIGISKIGTIEEVVNYDSTIHVSTDAKIANGEKVTVKGYGWKIGNEVYIKAPVEKGE